MEYLITFEDGSDGYLSHHGVLGMKWGVRNAETRARYASEGRAGSGGYSSGGASKGGLSKGQKRALKTAAIGLGTAAAIGGGVYLARTGGLKKLNTARKAAVKAAKNEHSRIAKNARNAERKALTKESIAKEERDWARGKTMLSDKEYRHRTILQGNEERSSIPKSQKDWHYTPYREYVNTRMHGRRIVERSRTQTTKKINAANNAYKKGKRRVDILTGAGGIMAVGAGVGTGAAYNKASRNRRS